MTLRFFTLTADMKEQSNGRLRELMRGKDPLVRQLAAAEYIRRFRVAGYTEKRAKSEVGDAIWNMAYKPE